jgi:hypothetical protein
MSDAVFAKGASADVRQLAEQITNSQRGEIRNMRSFREAMTGSPEPAPADAGTPVHTHPGDTEPHPH